MDEKKDQDRSLRGNTLERMMWSDWMNVVSGNECTGLIPALPIDFEKAEAYNDIYGVPVAESQDKINAGKDTIK